jgi:hypothetical protein
MDPLVSGGIVGFGAGTCGYIMVRFWFRPLMGYRRIKQDVALRLEQYLNHLEGEKNRKDGKTQAAMRRLSSDLTGSFHVDLPSWYRILLAHRGESPVQAAKHLMTLSNTRDPVHALKTAEKIRHCLNLPS